MTLDTQEKPALTTWEELPPDLMDSNREQADHIVVKLRAAGLWFRRSSPTTPNVNGVQANFDSMVESLARAEHDRWVAEKRRQGWIAAADTDRSSRDDALLIHNCLFPWDQLPEDLKEIDREAVRNIPEYLACAGYEVYKP